MIDFSKVITKKMKAEEAYRASIPQSVPRAQAMVVMIQSGVLDLAVDYIETIEDPTEKAIARVALYETNNYRRDSPFLLLAGDAIGLDDIDIDNLFIAAEQVKL